MTERDFAIGDRQFKLNKLDAFKQFHIVRRLGPILGDIIPLARKLKGVGDADSMSEEDKFSAFAEMVAPIMNGISKLSDADANLVLLGLCSAVEVRQPQSNSWARVAVGDNLMMGDLELPVLLQVAGRAFVYNLAGFFASAPQASHGGK